jgi:hypothetical protein
MEAEILAGPMPKVHIYYRAEDLGVDWRDAHSRHLADCAAW